MNAKIENSIISEGVTILDASIKNSVIRRGVIIEDNVSVEDCIIMDQVRIKKGCKLQKVIVDEQNVIHENEIIGFDPEKDRFHCHLVPSGVTIIPKGGRLIKAPKR